MDVGNCNGTRCVPVTPSYVKVELLPILSRTLPNGDINASSKRIAAKQLSSPSVPERERVPRIGSWISSVDSRRLQDLSYTRVNQIQPKNGQQSKVSRSSLTPVRVMQNSSTNEMENGHVRSNTDTVQRHVPLNKHRSESFIYDKLTKAPQHPFISRVIDYLYVGSVETAFCEPLLCRMKIEALVDVTNTRPNQVPPHKKTLCPCTCSLQTAHPRSRLFINIEDREDENLLPYFEDINKFIHNARSFQRNVLVFSMEGKSRGPALIVQYLMKLERLCYSSALQLVTSVRPSTKINPGFTNVLKSLEHASFFDPEEIPRGSETRKLKLFRLTWRKPDREAKVDVHPENPRPNRLKKPFLKSKSALLNSLPAKLTTFPFNATSQPSHNTSVPEITTVEPLSSSHTCLISELEDDEEEKEDTNSKARVQVLYTERAQAWI